MIQIPIEIGDTILTGKFKNHKVVVKTIEKDENGLPTVNGKGILKVRIEKLMKPKETIKEELDYKDDIVKPMHLKKGDQYVSTQGAEDLLVQYLGRSADGFNYNFKWVGRPLNFTWSGRDVMRFLKFPISESKIIKEGGRPNIPIEVKVKKEDGRFHLYLKDGDDCVGSPQGYETKEMAEKGALNRGFKLTDIEDELPETVEVKDPSKAEPIKFDKPKEWVKEVKTLIKAMLILEQRKKKVLTEGNELDAEIEEYAKLSDQIDRMKSELAKIETRFKELDEKFRVLLETMSKELDVTSKTYIRAKNILITIKRHGYDRNNVSYKDAFEFIRKKVSPQLRKMMDEVLETSKTVTYIKSQLGVQYEASGWLSNLYNKVKNFFVNSIKSLRSSNKQANQSLDQLEQML